jgi:hypothetical protein
VNVNLRFQKGSTIIQTTLRDEAFPELLKLVTQFESDEQISSTQTMAVPISEINSSDDNNQKSAEERIVFTKNWLQKHSPAEAISFLGWETFIERIVILGAIIEASGNDPGWRNADINERFSAARQPIPGNFARDISNAIKGGFVSTVTPRTYAITRSGWLKIHDQIIKRNVAASNQTE